MNSLTPEHVKFIREQIEALPSDPPQAQIDRTAKRLESLSYQPILMIEPPDFLRITKPGLLDFIDQIVANQDETALTEQHLNLLLHHFRLLQRLRRDDPEAWDEVSELVEED